jgi:putative nucleotidyltransferase with HDIG domain
MQTNSDIVLEASAFVSNLFFERLPKYMFFHTFDHSAQVANIAGKIGKAMKLGEEGMELVILAGLFHDTGYTEKYKGHEEVSVRIATDYLTEIKYPLEKITLIAGCIRATRIPQQPENILGSIVADADLAGFGRKSFFTRTELLHKEWEVAYGRTFSNEEWYAQSLELMMTHHYFTPVAEAQFSEQKSENIRMLKNNLRHNIMVPGK